MALGIGPGQLVGLARESRRLDRRSRAAARRRPDGRRARSSACRRCRGSRHRAHDGRCCRLPLPSWCSCRGRSATRSFLSPVRRPARMSPSWRCRCAATRTTSPTCSPSTSSWSRRARDSRSSEIATALAAALGEDGVGLCRPTAGPARRGRGVALSPRGRQERCHRRGAVVVAAAVPVAHARTGAHADGDGRRCRPLAVRRPAGGRGHRRCAPGDRLHHGPARTHRLQARAASRSRRGRGGGRRSAPSPSGRSVAPSPPDADEAAPSGPGPRIGADPIPREEARWRTRSLRRSCCRSKRRTRGSSTSRPRAARASHATASSSRGPGRASANVFAPCARAALACDPPLPSAPAYPPRPRLREGARPGVADTLHLEALTMAIVFDIRCARHAPQEGAGCPRALHRGDTLLALVPTEEQAAAAGRRGTPSRAQPQSRPHRLSRPPRTGRDRACRRGRPDRGRRRAEEEASTRKPRRPRPQEAGRGRPGRDGSVVRRSRGRRITSSSRVGASRPLRRLAALAALRASREPRVVRPAPAPAAAARTASRPRSASS